MEIKIHCACGAKYKFDAEPVHGRMPFAVNCPQCNADGTAQANEIIAQTIGTVRANPPLPAVAPPAEIALPPAGVAPDSTPQMARVVTGGGLRLSHGPASPPPTAETSSDDLAPPPPPPARMVARPVQPAAPKSKSGNKLVGALSAVLALL